ncbi:Metallo-beta-lactamase domain-containing protein [Trichinella spiralis]|uniref:Metallo-beta-lactamase domain-containing protein 1 n=1 Tax=Trichinella spiralis TaxID=6334 RepID=A0ABR3K8C9_TRISP
MNAPSIYVKQIIQGYCDFGEKSCLALGSVTLIKDDEVNILVDCAGPKQSNLLKKEEIDYLICTHGHLDHVGNINLFPEAIIFLENDILHGRSEYYSWPMELERYELTKNVNLMRTPGHTSHDISVVVENVPQKGRVIVAGDIFESELDLKQSDLWERSSFSKILQKESRKRILSLADHIIPGHDGMFEVKSSKQ